MENWTLVAAALKERLAADLLRFPDDQILGQLHDRLREVLGPSAPHSEPVTSRVICPHFNIDGTTIRTITVAARFESVADITLDEMRVEVTLSRGRHFRTVFPRSNRDRTADPRQGR